MRSAKCSVAIMVLLLVLVPCAVGVCAEAADCGCGGEANFPEATELLAQQGLTPDAYEVLLTWNETAPIGKAPVAGYHVKEKATGITLDIYTDCAGQILDTGRLTQLGIRQKNWNLKPLDVAGRSVAGAKSAAKQVAPSVTPVESQGQVTLPPVDLGPVLAEDEAAAEGPKGPARIGIFRELPAPIEVPGAPEWAKMPSGRRAWSLSLHSPGALGIRVHFAEFEVPEDAQVFIYNADTVSAGVPAEIYGPLRKSPDTEDYWAPTCFGERVIVSCETYSDTTTPRIRLDRVGHIYKGFDTVGWAKVADSCNLDVTCYPEWASVARGVAGIGTIGSAGILWCTGTLITDTVSSGIPYFLTANHCVGGQIGTRGASNCEFYWLYQTPTCDGTPPLPSLVPRTTGGADYLAGSGGDPYLGGGNDFTLLRLRQMPPAGMTYVGWSTVYHPPLTEVRIIHHPSRDYKRYSEAHTVAPTEDLQYHEIKYTAGTAEHGSSGCPLLLADTQQIIGQLWGGYASCSLPDESDFYGRFDITFPIVAQYLAPALPQVEFDPATVSVSEGNTGLTEVALSVRLGTKAGITRRVSYEVTGGSATPGTDYEPIASGTLEFEGTGGVPATIPIHIIGDTHTESDETITLRLFDPYNCELSGNATATVTILNDETDTDADGIGDEDESSGYFGYVTDPNAKDTDGDGFTDGEEVFRVFGVPMDPTEANKLSALSVPWFEDTE